MSGPADAAGPQGGLQAWVLARWYGAGPGLLWLLAPLEWLYAAVVAARRAWWRSRWARPQRLPRPVVVVGNIVAGGAGKTPLIAALAQDLAARGWRPGIVSRGYGRREDAPRRVDAAGRAADFGDEPLLLARQTGLPVAVGRDRPAAARLLLEAGCDLVLADDGLQHYRLARDIEIGVVPGRRGQGNGHLLPLGPLREPAARLAQCDYRVHTGVATAPAGDYAAPGRSGALHPLDGGAPRALSTLAGQEVEAVAAIADPGPFFATLDAAGLRGPRRRYPDHHAFGPADFAAGRLPLLMTAKDAVKCDFLQGREAYSLDYLLIPPTALLDVLDAQLRRLAATFKPTETHAG